MGYKISNRYSAKTALYLTPFAQPERRTDRGILVRFLADGLWKTLEQLCHHAGLGNEPRKVFQELAEVTLVDVLLPTGSGVSIRKRCISRPSTRPSRPSISVWKTRARWKMARA